ncbi:competence/damage-inducible protein A [Aureibaculum sp. 2210JD6-5]|uniref:competence/damage-inducible protein A n=1 Tax=Aureibaculum sp. 2210JD6-5 TaxID=3103957 RepID=UPI002AAC96FA|nr:competence/damage-inducible protein A [Aureibaculum sp. 2210JD6-5]MDY7394356.1 competence/damage-inducible protein A [Aureibaculum sp. 2210JD6-5]
MNAEIITIGDEILIGQIVDTNSAFIAQELNKIGISVYQITSVQDDKEHILKSLKEAEENADIIILTGGLGPTKDDITKHTICEYFNDSLVRNDEVLKHIENLFAKYISTPVSNINRQQALVPSKALILTNKFGTAPGMLLEKNDKAFISLPGVPYEMKGLITNEAIPYLQKKYNRPYIFHRTLLTYGLGESAIADRLDKWEDALPKNIKLAYLPNLGKVRLRLTAKGFDKDLLKSEMLRLEKELITYVDDIFVGFEGEESIETLIGKLLVAKNQTLATAESCTGGSIAKMITSVAGASKYFIGSVVSYNERIKTDILNVSPKTIIKHSVVSAAVAEEMAKGIQQLYKTDYAIAVTGNAGPTTDKTDTSVGVVFISLITPIEIITHEFNFGQPREKVIERASGKALEMLRTALLKKHLG